MESIEKFKKYKLLSKTMIFGGQGTSGSGCCSTNQQVNTQNQCLCPGGDTDHQNFYWTDDCDGSNKVTITGPVQGGGCS